MLGIHWDSDNDVFHVSISQEETPLISTKKGLVSDIARTYDVLGWFAPSIVVMKISLQQQWETNLDWDEEVTQDIQFTHLAWREQIPLLGAKAIPRYDFANSDAVVELYTAFLMPQNGLMLLWSIFVQFSHLEPTVT